jgi:hypothetical protein
MEYSIYPSQGFHRNVKLTLSTTYSTKPLLLVLPASSHYFFDIYELARLDLSASSSCFSSKLYVLGATDVDLESASHSLTSTPHFIILSLEPKSSPINQEALDRGLSVWQDALSVPFHLRYHPPSKDGDPLQTHLSFDIWSPFVFYSCLNTVGEINGTRKGNLATLTHFFLSDFPLAESEITKQSDLMAFINSLSQSGDGENLCGVKVKGVGSTTLQVPIALESWQPVISSTTFLVAIFGVVYVFYHLYGKLRNKNSKKIKRI